VKRTPLTRRTRLARTPITKRGKRGRRFKLSERNMAFREWIRGLRCVACPETATNHPERMDAHHVKTRGAGGRDEGNLAPLCWMHHNELHGIGRDSFAEKFGVDLSAVAARLWTQYQAHHGEDA
jgi:hypothetical protein